MNIIYLGILPPQHVVDEIMALGSYMDFATLTFEKALVTGLDHWCPDMRVVSRIRVDSFPKVNKIYFPSEAYSHKGENKKQDIFVGVINLPLLKRIHHFLAIRKALKEMIKMNDKNIVILYSMPSYQLLAVATLRKYINKSCLIVPDLPEFMTSRSGLLRRIGKAIDRYFIQWSLKRIDTYALLSPHMVERLPVSGNSWVQMEGLYLDAYGETQMTKDTHKVILYTGAVGNRYGVDDLIEAFLMIDDPSYRLWIRGNGASDEKIREMESKDSRIKYIPSMPKRELLELLQKATVLVNPVPHHQQFTRYFFPSKTMEYLASGTPVVMYHLDCMPSEYDEYLHYVDDESIKGLRDKIVEVCEMKREVLEEQGRRARRFILEQKNAVVQTKKIMDLINSKP